LKRATSFLLISARAANQRVAAAVPQHVRVDWELQAWLGHKNIQHTVRYTELAPDRFKNFWR
jgi:hypothetical protein